MAKIIEKIVKSESAPDKNVLWDNGKNLKINRRGVWENVNNDVYLLDTVVKTTPQTLSDTDKNQALTNLGIDPVV